MGSTDVQHLHFSFFTPYLLRTDEREPLNPVEIDHPLPILSSQVLKRVEMLTC